MHQDNRKDGLRACEELARLHSLQAQNYENERFHFEKIALGQCSGKWQPRELVS